ncbi:GDSL esterase/lipase At5g03610 [Euphorbia peplus]|nr:GDSL esterase/lipase At5g03610 [Euphorbia peplus]
MKKNTNYQFCFLLCYFFSILTVKEAHHRRRHGKLFVFGDSYVDTGNWANSAISWKQPYGITFPGTPSGRFSNGRVLTDYIASFVGVGSPIPYERRKLGNKSHVKYGMNFAYGGTGVFDTLNNAPNMATQIKFFKQIIEEEKVYTKQDLNSSIALVSIAGNDYNTYLFKNGNDFKDMGNLTSSIMEELSKNLKGIHELGVQKILITSLQPIGCLPAISVSSSFKNCSQKWNEASKFHNQMLNQQLQNLNNNIKGHEDAFHVLDLFGAFMSAFNKLQNITAESDESPLKACCRGITSNYSCADIDKVSGEKNYVICKNPELSIFWDMVHPSQNGWHQVHLALLSSLHQLFP